MCSSRRGQDGAGRLVVVATTADQFTPAGAVFYVLDPHGIGLFEPHGRPATPREQATARAPYQSTPRWDKRTEVPDDELSDEAAVAAAYAEQKRQPVDVFTVAA